MKDVTPGAAIQNVDAGAADQRIGPGRALDRVIAVQAGQEVAALLATQIVTARRARYQVVAKPGIDRNRGSIAAAELYIIYLRRSGQGEARRQGRGKFDQRRPARRQLHRCRGIGRGVTRHRRETAQLRRCQQYGAVEVKLFDTGNGRGGNVIARFDPQRVAAGAAVDGPGQAFGDRNQVVAGAAIGAVKGADDQIIVADATVERVGPGSAINRIIAAQTQQRVIAAIAAQRVRPGRRRNRIVPRPGIDNDRLHPGRGKGDRIAGGRAEQGKGCRQGRIQRDIGDATLGQIQGRRGIAGGIAGHQVEQVKLRRRHLHRAVQINLFDPDNHRTGDVIRRLESQDIVAAAAIQRRGQVALHRNQIVIGPAKDLVMGRGDKKVVVAPAVQHIGPSAAINAVIAIQAGQRVIARIAAQTVGTIGRGDAVIPQTGIDGDGAGKGGGKGQKIGLGGPGQAEPRCQGGTQVDPRGAALCQGQRCRGIVCGIARHFHEQIQLRRRHLNIAVQVGLFDAKDGRAGDIIAAFKPQRILPEAAVQNARQAFGDRNQVIAGAAIGAVIQPNHQVVIVAAAKQPVNAAAAVD